MPLNWNQNLSSVCLARDVCSGQRRGSRARRPPGATHTTSSDFVLGDRKNQELLHFTTIVHSQQTTGAITTAPSDSHLITLLVA